jgi:hypothetical protein
VAILVRAPEALANVQEGRAGTSGSVLVVFAVSPATASAVRGEITADVLMTCFICI